MMAWRYYSFARWPVPNSPGKQKAYENSLAAFHDYTRFLDPPLETVHIPFEGREIVGYLRLPKNIRPAPLVLAISALDSRKEDVCVQGDASLIRNGIGFFAVDEPGTGEAPIKADVGAERMFSRILDYFATRSAEIDTRRVVVRGNSWSGYWAAKLAYIEKDRLRGAVVQGGPIHDYFSPEWQKPGLSTREYLFDLFPARASVYGVGNDRRISGLRAAPFAQNGRVSGQAFGSDADPQRRSRYPSARSRISTFCCSRAERRSKHGSIPTAAIPAGRPIGPTPEFSKRLFCRG